MNIVIVTGMSGAGKSTALNVFEDLDYYCIDNMPPELLSSFAELIRNSAPKTDKICFAVDVRARDLFSKFQDSVMELRRSGAEVTVVFIDCDDGVLINRYKETRRRHPLEDEASGNLMRAIGMEREELAGARKLADIYIDSTSVRPVEFKNRIRGLFSDNTGGMIIDVISFGYMFGIPKDADLVFDVRCFDNPFYVPELRSCTGLDDEVYSYVFGNSEAVEIYDRIYGLVTAMIPLCEKEGKNRFVVAFGCTGGKHRSVSFARRLSDALIKDGYEVRVEHRCLIK